MCGIAGVFCARGAPDRGGLERMADSLRHRGPDEASVWAAGPIGLAHTRLSIIDVAGSHQPMHSPDGAWSIVFNGEIFNYRELRRGLDHTFRTQGDTEVLMAGLMRHGIGFVDRLRGQFAFAAHHHPSGTLHLVRDRLGVLPLYYRHDGRGVVFGSEVKAITAYTARAPGVDPDSLDAYLEGRSVPAPHTLYAGVAKLPPAHRAEIRATGCPVLHRYWTPPPVADPGIGADEVVEEADRLIRDAVRAALVADVPVGSYLSGGVDSSLIVAIMKQLRGNSPVETFAAGFGDPRFDELDWAQRVSDRIGTRHHTVAVRAEDFIDLWPSLTWHRDAPISEPADIAVFRLAASAGKHVKVVLSGEGGDELFGGYPKYRYASWARAARRIPSGPRRAVGRLLDARLPPRLGRQRIALRALSAGSEADQLATWFAPFTREERRGLIGRPPSPDRLRRAPEGVDDVDRMLRNDLAGWLPDNLLERGDRMTMAASVELRPPLLDHRLVEFAFGLPSALKVRDRVPKWLLKQVARRYLPDDVVFRPKVGFRVPLDRWFRAGLRETARDRLVGGDSFVGSALDRRAVIRLLDRHESGRHDEEIRIWTLLSLEVWHEVCVAGWATSRRAP
ncbi:asparagine synthase (glutamine-hydrolyzing) [Acidipropionibacterium acidipropionici]|uniref:asparagine synthase (glutamine-hydrolyzing) n=2 Tax=Acidipropionibacterium acidipropionici TaxID=1748 RepID=A0AAC8YCV6_9ACTN|nr:asparagine synthetase B [Acidipropionibacterium acidipropionici]AOZ45867.1 asparagine synthase (glutamine-hydrolyzing) [Acidipropionibacterium acidipropionici]AZP38115.1 asparagine synthase (glutamine-hydrolyzing) [Acidipropionibacterium acidipropionici]